ncbi:hypothetical protein LX36DRAFT_663725 [Colletotrichum falcatum]|nr:hypothetical protein LX36DRAFT_663725 [Colletotrichum falcatum]
MDFLKVNTNSKRLTVVWAMNGFDRTPSRLKMRQILAGCWKMTGLRPADLKEIKGSSVSNDNMKDALDKCRTDMRLPDKSAFSVLSTDGNGGKKRCWERLGRTIFFSSIKGAISELGIDRKVVEFRVRPTRERDDNIYISLGST